MTSLGKRMVEGAKKERWGAMVGGAWEMWDEPYRMTTQRANMDSTLLSPS